jgi:hypothetical protein
MAFSTDPVSLLAGQGVTITGTTPTDQRRRGVTDLITLSLCARHARQFSQRRYPAQTPATVLGHILHRTIKHLHDRYRAMHQAGTTTWFPTDADIREECQIALEAARAHGLPPLSPEQAGRLEAMLCAFHALEAPTFYPRVREAEVDLCWLWEEAPGGPVLLEGKVDVILTQSPDPASGIVLWDYKAARQPRGGAELLAYRRQMELYALLYQRCFGVAPQGTVLYFLGELVGRKRRHTRPVAAVVSVPVVTGDDGAMMAWLRHALERDRRCVQERRWDPPSADDVPERLCRTCLARWSCLSFHEPFPWQEGMSQGQDDYTDDLEV